MTPFTESVPSGPALNVAGGSCCRGPVMAGLGTGAGAAGAGGFCAPAAKTNRSGGTSNFTSVAGWKLTIEREVQFQYIDAWLAQKAKIPAFDGREHKPLDI